MTPLTLDEQHEIRSAQAWFPWRKEGAGQPDTVTGEVVSLDSVWSDYQGSSRVAAVIRETDGTMWSIRTYPTRLHDEWLSVQPQIGETVSVRFLGLVERKKDGREYPDFSIAVERNTPSTFDYDRMGPDEPGDSDESEPPEARDGAPTAESTRDTDDDLPF